MCTQKSIVIKRLFSKIGLTCGANGVAKQNLKYSGNFEQHSEPEDCSWWSKAPNIYPSALSSGRKSTPFIAPPMALQIQCDAKLDNSNRM